MPIKFRCPHCRQFLGISRSKAGAVTDCPTCGRTIRVPHLDGTVVPLPSVKMNLNDTDLRQALGALASIHDEEESGVDSDFAVGSAIFRASPKTENPNEPVIAQPVQRPEPEPAAIVEAPDAGQSLEELKAMQALSSSDIAVPILDVEPIPQRERPQRRNQQISPWWAVAGFLLLACGFILGRFSVGSPKSQAASDEQPAEVEAPNQEIPQVDQIDQNHELTQLHGTITYESANGKFRPDKGARILVLPIERIGTSMVPFEGMRVGAAGADQKLLQASIAALGGGLAFADDAGEYMLPHLAAGKYLVVFVSRYLQRDESTPIDEQVATTLGFYFDSPHRALGLVQHSSAELEITEPTDKVLDYQFEQ